MRAHVLLLTSAQFMLKCQQRDGNQRIYLYTKPHIDFPQQNKGDGSSQPDDVVAAMHLLAQLRAGAVAADVRH